MTLNRMADVTAVVFFSALIIFPQSYFEFRISLLVVYLITHGILLAVQGRLIVSRADLLFYAGIALCGLVWAAIGVYNGGDARGVVSGLKLYVAWSAVYLVVISFYRNCTRLALLHMVFVVSTLCIAIINLAALLDAALQTGLASPAVIKELGLGVAFYGGYIRFESLNIASLFFLMGYLVAYRLCKRDGRPIGVLSNLAIVLGLIVTALAGRRALWLIVAAVPVICLVIAFLSGTLGRLSERSKHLTIAYLLIGGATAAFYFLADESHQPAALTFVKAAFSAEDERTIQKDYLIDGFVNYPVLGSGFGAYAGYSRSAEMPWLYELTYHQMLFNVGVVGAAVLLLGFLYFFRRALAGLRAAKEDFAVRLGMLVGFFAILFGAYSNPYLQFFDSLIFVMFFACLSTPAVKGGGSTRAIVSPVAS